MVWHALYILLCWLGRINYCCSVTLITFILQSVERWSGAKPSRLEMTLATKRFYITKRNSRGWSDCFGCTMLLCFVYLTLLTSFFLPSAWLACETRWQHNLCMIPLLCTTQHAHRLEWDREGALGTGDERHPHLPGPTGWAVPCRPTHCRHKEVYPERREVSGPQGVWLHAQVHCIY